MSNARNAHGVNTVVQLKAAMAAMGLTDFQRAVLLATKSIKKGDIATYKQIAERIGHPNAYRAVGSVLRNNTFAPYVPCHRVIRSDGSAGKYSAKGGTKAKLARLRSEGAI